jgi:hypothetical protein
MLQWDLQLLEPNLCKIQINGNQWTLVCVFGGGGGTCLWVWVRHLLHVGLSELKIAHWILFWFMSTLYTRYSRHQTSPKLRPYEVYSRVVWCIGTSVYEKNTSAWRVNVLPWSRNWQILPTHWTRAVRSHRLGFNNTTSWCSLPPPWRSHPAY